MLIRSCIFGTLATAGVELPETWQNNLAQVIGFYPPERLLPSELPIGAVLEFFGLVQKQLPHLKRIKVDRAQLLYLVLPF